MTDLTALKAANAKLWATAKILPNRRADVMAVAKRLVAPAAKEIYQSISKFTGVPWFAIAVIHEREASQRWDRQLGQGDPLNEVSHNRPAGRGPFKTFAGGAIDALVNCPPYASKNKDWSAGGTLAILEQYNGTGYEDYHHEVSPYIWGATDQGQRGKYVQDGKFDPSKWDEQVGCAAMLMGMMALDRTISFDGKMPPIVAGDTKPAPTDLHEKDNEPNRGPEPPGPSFASAFAKQISLIPSLFGRK